MEWLALPDFTALSPEADDGIDERSFHQQKNDHRDPHKQPEQLVDQNRLLRSFLWENEAEVGAGGHEVPDADEHE
jgi:hypothetical protein